MQMRICKLCIMQPARSLTPFAGLSWACQRYDLLQGLLMLASIHAQHAFFKGMKTHSTRRRLLQSQTQNQGAVHTSYAVVAMHS